MQGKSTGEGKENLNLHSGSIPREKSAAANTATTTVYPSTVLGTGQVDPNINMNVNVNMSAAPGGWNNAAASSVVSATTVDHVGGPMVYINENIQKQFMFFLMSNSNAQN